MKLLAEANLSQFSSFFQVHQDDKMPPLICELCVDKVNDFYEFLEMCRQTNKRTRLRLGLPPQSMPRGAVSKSYLFQWLETLTAKPEVVGSTQDKYLCDEHEYLFCVSIFVRI